MDLRPRLTEVICSFKMESALASMQRRKVTHLVEEALLNCHTAAEVREAAKLPLKLPLELERPDRRELDDAVFELLGVQHMGRRAELVDRLYREVALHFRSVRVVEVQKMEQRRHGANKDRVSQVELALDAWNELEPEWQKPLSAWLEEQTGNANVVNLPDGAVRLPAAEDFFDATTVYFGKNPAVSLVCGSRAEAELIAIIAREGVRGPVSLPATERECRLFQRALEARLLQGRERLRDLAEQRAGTDKLREQVVELLTRWFIFGKGERQAADAAKR